MNLLDEFGLARRSRLPVIVAAEGGECGLACMAMIGVYHGHAVDLNGLRQRFPLSMSGASLRSLMTLADELGFGARPVKVELEGLPELQTPALLHWNLNHFVVLKEIKRGKATIHDPASGARTFTLAEVGRHFTGIALELAPAAHFEPVRARSTMRLRNLWSSARGLGGAVAQVLVLSVALQVATFVAPFQIQLVVDQAIGRGDTSLLSVLALGFGALIVLQALLDALRNWAVQVFGNLLTFQLMGNIVRHLLRLPWDFFEKRHAGDILSRMSSTQSIQDALAKGIVSTLIDGVMALAAAVILFFYSGYLAGVVLAAVAVNLIISLVFFPQMRARTEEQLVSSANERSHMMESVRAANIIKLMGREAERESAWRNLYGKVINAAVAIARYEINVGAAQAIVTGLSTVLIIYLGARMTIAGDGFSIGMLLAFLSFRQTFSDRAMSLVTQSAQLRLLGLHLERLSDIVTAKVETQPGPSSPLQVAGAISLRNVSFRYGAADPWILRNFNLEIEAGEYVALVGPSGGGKTTLMKLLLGLQQPTEGEIFLDGRLATPELWRAWRRKVGVVSQEDRLLSGSVADNIAFFDPDMDMAKVEAAACTARVHDEIVRKPMRYMSLVGDMGSTLSGGQKQRVLLARALYRDPQLLFLDEGTANLDEASEQAIADFLAGLEMTRVIVAHRPALIRCASRVISIAMEAHASDGLRTVTRAVGQ